MAGTKSLIIILAFFVYSATCQTEDEHAPIDWASVRTAVEQIGSAVNESVSIIEAQAIAGDAVIGRIISDFIDARRPGARVIYVAALAEVDAMTLTPQKAVDYARQNENYFREIVTMLRDQTERLPPSAQANIREEASRITVFIDASINQIMRLLLGASERR